MFATDQKPIEIPQLDIVRAAPIEVKAAPAFVNNEFKFDNSVQEKPT